MGERPQSFSDLLGTWAAGLTIWAQEFLTPIVERIIAHMDEYVDSRARAIIREELAKHSDMQH